MEDNNITELEAKRTETGTSIIRINDTIKGEFEIDANKSENTNKALLGKKEIITLAGNFTAKTLGKKTLVAIFNYDEGEEVRSKILETEAIQVSLSIKLDESSSLPEKLPLNSEEEVEFLVTNESGLDATEITLETELLNEVTIVKQIPDGEGNYKTESPISLEKFNQQGNNSLDHTHRFRINGKIKIVERENNKLSVLVKYKELETLAVNDPDKNGKKFAKDIEIVEVPIAMEVIKPLPNKIKLGVATPVSFKFTNQSEQFAATNVQIEITQAEQKKNL